jgi:hypothetical protein
MLKLKVENTFTGVLESFKKFGTPFFFLFPLPDRDLIIHLFLLSFQKLKNETAHIGLVLFKG